MRLATLSSALLLALTVAAQTTVTVSTAPGNADQVFYSLQNGEQATAPLAEWDLAFEITGFTSSILVNTAKGLLVYETPAPFSAWESVNAPDEANWTLIHNSETTWSVGALNHGNNLEQPDGFDLGWGTYNIITHTIAGTKIYVIDDGQGNYRKLRINSLLSGTYDFTYADLDGSNEVNGTLSKQAYLGRNFGYWSMATNSAIDREPPTSTWELLFTKYIGFIPGPYALAGVLHNKNIEVLQVDGVPTGLADPWSGDYSAEINTIGADWKSFNMNTFSWEYAEDRCYFVKDHAGNIWKLIFIAYGGAANGQMTFTQELVSATSVQEGIADMGFTVYPNPVRDGRVQLVLDAPLSTVDMLVYDASGRVVMTERLNGLGGLEVRTLDVARLRSGLYTIRLQGDGVLATTRLVVE
jgi:hypothetical protein